MGRLRVVHGGKSSRDSRSVIQRLLRLLENSVEKLRPMKVEFMTLSAMIVGLGGKKAVERSLTLIYRVDQSALRSQMRLLLGTIRDSGICT